MWLTNAFIERPGIILCSSMAVCLIFVLISVFSGFLNLDDMSNREFLIWKDKPTTNQDMTELSRKWAETNSVEIVDEYDDIVIPSRTEEGESIFLLYESKSDSNEYGLLSKEMLLQTKAIEEFIQQ
jgi:hypothetical protein